MKRVIEKLKDVRNMLNWHWTEVFILSWSLKLAIQTYTVIYNPDKINISLEVLYIFLLILFIYLNKRYLIWKSDSMVLNIMLAIHSRSNKLNYPNFEDKLTDHGLTLPIIKQVTDHIVEVKVQRFPREMFVVLIDLREAESWTVGDYIIVLKKALQLK